MPDEIKDEFWNCIAEQDVSDLVRIYGSREKVREAFSDYLSSVPDDAVGGLRTPSAFAAIRLAYEII